MHANKMAQSHPLTYVSIYYSEKTSTLLNEPKRDFSSLPLKSLRLFGAILSKRRRSPPSISPEMARVHSTHHFTSLLFAASLPPRSSSSSSIVNSHDRPKSKQKCCRRTANPPTSNPLFFCNKCVSKAKGSLPLVFLAVSINMQLYHSMEWSIENIFVPHLHPLILSLLPYVA